MNRFLKALGHTRVYPLTDTQISGLTHAQQVQELSKSGAKLIQLREKRLSPGEFHKEAAEAVAVARSLGVQIVINDRVDIGVALKADGVHLGQDDLSPVDARTLLGPDCIIGISTHNLQQAQLALTMPVDYVAVGPIFATSTKNSVDPPLGFTGLQEVKAILGSMPVVAIGGIDEGNAPGVWSAGADAVAMISNLWIPHGGAAERRSRILQFS